MVGVALAVVCLVLLGVMTLTALGSRRRGTGLALAVVAGACFPATWTAWYVRDERRASFDGRRPPRRGVTNVATRR